MVQRGNGEGSVYQEGRRAGRTDGRWIAQLMVDGRARRRIAPSQAAAKRALREMQAELARGSDVGHGNLTVRQLAELWQQKALPSRNLSDRTIHSYHWAGMSPAEWWGSRDAFPGGCQSPGSSSAVTAGSVSRVV